MFKAPKQALARAERTLRTQPAMGVKMAKEGSLEMLEAISLNGDVISVQHARDVSDLLWSNLSPTLMPDLPISLPLTMALTSTINRAFLSLGVACHLYVYAMGTPSSREHYVSKLWPITWAWFLFFEEFQSSAPEEIHLRDDFFSMLGQALWPVLKDTAGWKLVLDSPGSVRLLTSFWMKDDPSKQPGRRPACASVLAAVLSVDDDTVIERFVACVGGLERSEDADAIAARAVGPFEEPPPADPEVETDMLFFNCHVVLMVAFEKSPILRDALLRRGAIRAVIRNAISVTKYFFDPDDAILNGATVRTNLCLTFLHKVLETGAGTCWIRAAIQDGLLDVFTILSPVFHRIPKGSQMIMIDIVRDMLPRYYVYSSVIMPVARAMRQSSMQNLLNGPPMSQLGSLLKDTSTIVLRYSTLKRRQRNSSQDVGYCDCCGARYPRSKLKRCARCRSVAYCSESCQRHEWDSLHKHECTRHTEWSTIPQELATPDRRFHLQLVISDVQRHLSALLESARESPHPNIALEDLGVLVNYTIFNGPGLPKLGLYRLSDCHVSQDDKIKQAVGSRLESIVAKASHPRRRGRTTLIESWASLGEKTAIFLTLVAPAVWPDRGHTSRRESDFRIVDTAVAYVSDRSYSFPSDPAPSTAISSIVPGHTVC
ncbi:hypothetical protein FA95DRAFT_303669 [Auriscalpium vulgare]|uniref:Uncharacterized protein n=1 Tax=Auriscalpium vulgare TaxID=40419 RepID=A0ACB8RJ02_9AGAM|nr:hypothetical protein FA95DRAFT_303669 [Auriscalpium vulgare]